MVRRASNPARSEARLRAFAEPAPGAVADNAPMQIVPIEPVRRGRE